MAFLAPSPIAQLVSNASLDDFTAPLSMTLGGGGAGAIKGTESLSSPSTPPGASAWTGGLAPTFGTRVWFVHTHTVTRDLNYDVGFVISAVTRNFEVFNGRRSGSETLAAPVVSPVYQGVTLSGDTGSDPYTLPANSSRYYTLTVAQNGSVAIDASIAIDGTNDDILITVVGKRVIVFAFGIDWKGGFEERIGYLTNVMPCYDETEQRVALRTIPRPGARYAVKALDARETQTLLNGLSVAQARLISIPWWPDASPLAAALGAGSSTVTVDTTTRPGFVAGGEALLWHSPVSWEMVEIDTVSAGSVALLRPTVAAFAAGDAIIPVKFGRIKSAVDLAEIVRDYTAFEIDFAGEVV